MGACACRAQQFARFRSEHQSPVSGRRDDRAAIGDRFGCSMAAARFAASHIKYNLWPGWRDASGKRVLKHRLDEFRASCWLVRENEAPPKPARVTIDIRSAVAGVRPKSCTCNPSAAWSAA